MRANKLAPPAGVLPRLTSRLRLACWRATWFLGLMPGWLAGPVWADVFLIDPLHTSAQFAVSHLGFSTARGRFDKTDGRLELDLPARKGQITVQLDANSISTGDPDRDSRLKGSWFFNTERYPEIRFISKRLVFVEERLDAVEGELTLLGVTRPFSFKVERWRCGFHTMALRQACGADLSGTLQRSDFGMKAFIPLVGDEVKIDVSVEALAEVVTPPARER